MVLTDPAGDVWWDTSSHDNVSLFIELYASQRFRECVADVERGADLSDIDLIVFNPVLECEVFRIHMSSASCWLLCIVHM